MRLAFFAAILVSMLLLGCSNEPSLQKYFVEKSESKDFIVVDISSSIINVDRTKLTEKQSKALQSFDKMNILAFKLNNDNKMVYATESDKVTKILKGKEYQELMKIGSGKDAASVSFVGDENNIDEFVLFAKKKDNGFAVVRILGNDMNPDAIMTMLSLIKNSDVDMSQLEPLKDLVK